MINFINQSIFQTITHLEDYSLGSFEGDKLTLRASPCHFTFRIGRSINAISKIFE